MEIEKPEWLGQFEGLLETLNQGVLIADDCQRIVFINSCFEEMICLPADQVLGRHNSSFFSPEENKLIGEQIELGAELGHHRFEFVLPKNDGSRLPVIISSRRVEDPDGRTFAIVTFTDISEQKDAESRLRDANFLLQERQREIEEDLALAARVQQSLTPKSLHWGNLRVESYFHPVHTIGGDFGLVSPQDEDHLNLLVCDVSGHGIGSALVANRIYSEIVTQLQSGEPLAGVFAHLNRFVIQNIASSGFFFTVAAARIDYAGRRMYFAGAGHPPAMIARAGQEPLLLESRSAVLGVLPNAVSADATWEVELTPGDRVVLYTDGITDIFDARGEMLGVPGVREFVGETSGLPFSEMKRGILDRIAAWREGPPIDDVSLVLVEVI